jgi:hypothetical protein
VNGSAAESTGVPSLLIIEAASQETVTMAVSDDTLFTYTYVQQAVRS